jgi:F-type H+-transporting ATPase subunit delta
MASAKRYARAVFETAQTAGDHDAWTEHLSELSAALQHKDLLTIMNAPTITEDEKIEVLKLLVSKFTEGVELFCRLLIQQGSMPDVLDITKQYQNLVDTVKGVSRVVITSAIKLDTNEKAKLTKQLSVQLKKEIELSESVDESLIGGVVIKIGDKVLDGSIKGRLDSMRASLLNG